MLFNTWSFVFFFPLVVAFYYLISHRFRWIFLLIASYYFYMCWKPEYVLLIVTSTLIDYYTGLKMSRLDDRRKRKKYLYLSLITNLGLLFSFKYFNFVSSSVQAVFDQFNIFYNVPHFDVLLPVGISFYTFQTLSYSIDIYRGNRDAERHLGIFALFVSFFPQLVAGPIERSDRLIPQLKEEHKIDPVNIIEGLKLMCWGYFKKVVIADRVAAYVDQVFNHPQTFSGGATIIAAYFFVFQIYCDFSGYSDIARGTARVMGYNIINNFTLPFFSKSIPEFWRRWHVSLSFWFRDYLYIPLGGNRLSKTRTRLNLFMVFTVAGIWHGANWTFLFWGALHGLFLVLSDWTFKFRQAISRLIGLDRAPGLQKFVRVMITFHLFVISMVIFRAQSIPQALYLFKNTFSVSFLNPEVVVGFSFFDLSLAFVFIASLISIELLQRKEGNELFLSTRPVLLRRSIYVFIVLAIVLAGEFKAQDFIYFQF